MIDKEITHSLYPIGNDYMLDGQAATDNELRMTA